MHFSRCRQYRSSMKLLVLLMVVLGLSTSSNAWAQRRRADSPRDVDGLLTATERIRSMDEAAVIALVPLQSGFNYVDCPNCTGGRQENQLAWSLDHPDEVFCKFCQHRFPSSKFPMNQAVTVQTPLGRKVEFPYWADASGYRHFFQSKRDDEVRIFLAQQARDLADLYLLTRDESHARRSAVILDRFAEVYPNWCYHYDYPFRQKEIYSGAVSPQEFKSGFRTARWTWWAYMDIPLPLVQAYAAIRESHALKQLSTERGLDVEARIRRDLFRSSCEQVLANEDPLSNMSPRAWQSLIVAGRVLSEPKFVHESVRRLRRLVESQFFYDGFWCEGSPDYGAQSLSGLEQTLEVLDGYSDPPGYVDPVDGSRFDKLDLASQFSTLNQVRKVLALMHLPNGRAVPVHDTWSFSRRGRSEVTRPFLLPALGHACLGGGEADRQTQFHVTWSGGYGHSHGDNLSLLLFAHGAELLSDIGYTHTAYRAWTLATVAHNTVVIDGQNQSLGRIDTPTDGSLVYFDAAESRVQIVSATGQRGYPGLARDYRRTLFSVDSGDGDRYAVDVFEVEGGRTHDYFLHGDADRASRATCQIELAPLDSLLPDGFGPWEPTRNEGETRKISEPWYAYGFLRELQSAKLVDGQTPNITFTSEGAAGPSVRITLLPEVDSQLVIGRNPSVRMAQEDDTRLEKFQRPFAMLRHSSVEGKSRFVSLIEPNVGGMSKVQSVERLAMESGALVVKVVLPQRIDWIVVNRPAEGEIQWKSGNDSLRFRGQFGLLSQSTVPDSDVDYAYAAGDGGWTVGEFELRSRPSVSKELIAVDANRLTVEIGDEAPPVVGSTVRLTTRDGWVYPFTVKSATVSGTQLRLETQEPACLRLDSQTQQLEMTSFPQRRHAGSVSLGWTPHAARFRNSSEGVKLR